MAVRAPKRDGEPVALAAGEDLARDLGRLAEADRQHAGGERIEAADVPGLAAAEQPAHALQRRVGRQPARLVEQQDARLHGASQRRVGSSLGPAAGALGGDRRDRCSRGRGARPSPTVSSNTKSSRGACRSPSRRPTSPRRNPAARVSPLRTCSGGCAEANGVKKTLRRAHVGGQAHRRDGDVADARVLDLARDQLREHALHLRLDLAQPAALALLLITAACAQPRHAQKHSI